MSERSTLLRAAVPGAIMEMALKVKSLLVKVMSPTSVTNI